MKLTRRRLLDIAGITGGALILPASVAAQGGVEAPVPPILSVNEIPPERSASVVLRERKDQRMNLFADSDNSSKSTYVSDIPGRCPPRSGMGKLVYYWDGKPPADYTLTLRQFWRLIDNSYTTIPEGNTQTQTFSHSWGISQTDAESISATLGFDEGGISGSVTATYSRSVTTDDSRSIEVTRQIAPPGPGMVRVWMMWQLVHEIVALDAQGNAVTTGYRGPDTYRKGQVSWAQYQVGRECPTVVILPPSGAFLFYSASRWQFPSKIIRPSQRDFAIS